MEFSALQIAGLLDGKVEGNQDVTVDSLTKIEEGKKNSISFLSNQAYAKYIYDTDASIVIVDNQFKAERELKSTCTLIRVGDARLAFSKLIEAYQQYKNNKEGVSKHAYVSESAHIGKNVYIAPGVAIDDNVVIGDNVKLYPNVSVGNESKIGNNTVIYSGCQIMQESIIGNDCMFQPGVVIGSDGFGFAPNSENQYQKIIHLGNVIIEDNVELGANTVIDRATLGATIIRKGVKLDNFVQIAHNVEIGENTVMASHSAVAGSVKVGKNCMIGGQVGIVGHITIADGTKIAAQSGIGQSIKEEGTVLQGSPAFRIGQYQRSYIMYKNLPKIKKQIDELEKELSSLKSIINE